LFYQFGNKQFLCGHIHWSKIAGKSVQMLFVRACTNLYKL
jgi:hypothetical protein